MKNDKGGYTVWYRDEGIEFEITVEPGGACWFSKSIILRTEKDLPTPDFVEVDAQNMKAPGLKLCGYRITDGRAISPQAEEEGGGVTPGCGYPLIGDELFTGLEHPAAFNVITSREQEKTAWSLRHFPIWQNREIRSVRAITGIDTHPREQFMEYLAELRLPILKNFLVSFCSFWSDPYLGNYDYLVDSGNYRSLVKAFSRLGLRPDLYTLDAGWQNRKSFYSAKQEFGGDAALKKIAVEFRKHGANLSLWVSHNGPMGMERDFLISQEIAVGSGQSSSYCGKDYAVMMDPKLEKALTKRFCQLCSPEFGAVHFKMDWENDCATNPDFKHLYPTRDHVREASINMMSRIADAMRRTNPAVMTRNGWWPSPWWLTRTNHTFLTDSGDSEYACFPSLTQRDAASTQRDLMYYAQQRRDQAAYPLDAYDNHEFSHALRNPFIEQPGTWSNTCLWTVMRGASYLPLTLQPEAMETWQAELLRNVLAFARKHALRILTGRSYMFGGNPGHGEIYGFCHPTEKHTLLALRNPSPIPQQFVLPEQARHWCQTYPHCQNFEAGETIWFASHEVKLFNGLERKIKFPAEICQLMPTGDDKKYQICVPALLRPGVAEIYQISELKCVSLNLHQEKNSSGVDFGIRSPYKMRSFQLFLKLKNELRNQVSGIRLSASRYAGWEQCSCWQVPFRELHYNAPGYGEQKNPDLQPAHDARYFAADIPQGGECFFRLEFFGTTVLPELELYASGYEAPASKAESWRFSLAAGVLIPPQHPEGFIRTLKLM